MRPAGTVHAAASRSTSDQRAARAAPERAAVSTMNSNASLTTGRAEVARIAASAAATSACGSARMCRMTFFCLPSTGPSRSQGLSAR